MSTLKRWLLGATLVLAGGSLGGYLYLRKAFSAPPNALAVAPNGQWIDFAWAGGAGRGPHQALLVPVRLEGHPRGYWMQFDLGAPYSVLYSAKVASLQARHGGLQVRTREGRAYVDDLALQIGPQPLQARQIRVRATREGMKADPDAVEVIGTLGSDFIDGRVLVIDYPGKRLALWSQVPEALSARAAFSPLAFKERRILLSATLDGRVRDVMFDTGSSAYALLTSRPAWAALARPGATPDQFGVNSWGKTLQVHVIATDAALHLGATRLPLGEVAYVEGVSAAQEWMMRLSGMGGMTGNRLFLERTIVVDTRGGRFGLLP